MTLGFDKKGQRISVINLLLGALIIIALAYAIVSAGSLFTDLKDSFVSQDLIPQEQEDELDERVSDYPTWMDNVFLFFFVGIWCASLVASFKMANSPLIAIIVVFIIFIIGLGAGYLSNQWDDFTGTDLGQFSSNFPKTDWVLDNFLVVMGFVGFSNIAAMMMGRGRAAI